MKQKKKDSSYTAYVNCNSKREAGERQELEDYKLVHKYYWELGNWLYNKRTDLTQDNQDSLEKQGFDDLDEEDRFDINTFVEVKKRDLKSKNKGGILVKPKPLIDC